MFRASMPARGWPATAGSRGLFGPRGSRSTTSSLRPTTYPFCGATSTCCISRSTVPRFHTFLLRVSRTIYSSGANGKIRGELRLGRLPQEAEDFEAFFHERANGFGLYSDRMTVKHECIARSFDAESRLFVEEAAHLVGEQRAHRRLVAALQQILAQERRVVVEVDVLVAEPGTDLVGKILGAERKLGQPRAVEAKANHRMVPRMAVLAAAGDIAVV